MSATGQGLTSFNVTLAAAAGLTSSVVFTHTKAGRALAVIVTDQTTGSVLREGIDVQVTQPTVNTVRVDNLTAGIVSVRVKCIFQEDSTQANLLAAGDARLTLGAGVVAPAGVITGAGVATRLAYWSAASVLTSDADLTFAGDVLSVGTGAALALQAASPAQIVGNTNDYAIGAGSNFRIGLDAPHNITGIVAGADGRIIVVTNVSANTATLMNLDGASAAANQINTGTGANLAVAQDDSATLIYDATTAKWRVIAFRG